MPTPYGGCRPVIMLVWNKPSTPGNISKQLSGSAGKRSTGTTAVRFAPMATVRC
jgi:hypothetical protein